MKTCIIFGFLFLFCGAFGENKTSERFKEIENIELGFEGNLSDSTVKTHKKAVVCAINEWSSSREPASAFGFTDVDANLCTHILVRVFLIDNITFQIRPGDVTLRADGKGPGWWTKLSELKKNNPNVKLMVSVGGWLQGVELFQQITSDHQKRETFVQSAVSFLKKYKFDGLNVEWMWPGVSYRGGNQADKKLLTVLLFDLKTAFKPSNYQLAVQVFGKSNVYNEGYDIPKLSNIVDYFFLLTIDYSGEWEKKTGHHSPLQTSSDNQDSIADFVENIIRSGAPPQKLILAIGFFGRTFNLKDDQDGGHGLGKPSQGGFSGSFYDDKQGIGYNEICKELTYHANDWSVYRDSDAGAPFMRNGSRWVSFDDPQTVREKVAFGVSKGLGGFMAWTIDTGDFQGAYCQSNGVKYPLLRTINQELTKIHNKTEGKIGGRMGMGTIVPYTTTVAPRKSSKSEGFTTLSSVYHISGFFLMLMFWF